MDELDKYITQLIRMGLQFTNMWRGEKATSGTSLTKTVHLHVPLAGKHSDYIMVFRMHRHIGDMFWDLLRSGYPLKNLIGEFLCKAFMQSNRSRSIQFDPLTGEGLVQDIQGNDFILSLTLDNKSGREILQNVY
jgi:hypothetical protein